MSINIGFSLTNYNAYGFLIIFQGTIGI